MRPVLEYPGIVRGPLADGVYDHFLDGALAEGCMEPGRGLSRFATGRRRAAVGFGGPESVLDGEDLSCPMKIREERDLPDESDTRGRRGEARVQDPQG